MKYSPEVLQKKLPEWTHFESLLKQLPAGAEIHFLGSARDTDVELPLLAVSFGSQDPKAPTLGLFGGVHGLERIGSQVVLSLMNSFCQLLLWDESLQKTLQNIRVVFMPMINPIGILKKTRSNPQGVDLMRNAPVEAIEKPTFLVGGQTYTPRLPWYRGASGKMEVESQAVIDFCQTQIFASECAITLDFHSGFGVQDQLWFPYAKTTQAFPHLPEMFSLLMNLNRTFPNHFYKVEPQALNYTTHGDLWDYAYELYQSKSKGVFLPLCLEMGSWMWVRKNPWQLFSSLGPFNPMKPHRQKRILRRHQTLFDFMIRSVASHKTWAYPSQEQKSKYESQAMEYWYAKR